MNMRTIVISSVLLLANQPIGAQSLTDKPEDSAWKKLEFLLGRWMGSAGEKDTVPGAGQADFPSNWN
jgi:hypothetical protein